MKTKATRIMIFAAAAMMAVAFGSCDNRKFRVSGTLADAKDSVLYFENMSLDGPVTVDSVKLDGKGEFSFTDKAPEAPEFYRLRIAGQIINLSVDSTESIVVNASYPTMATGYTVEGSAECATIKELSLKCEKNDLILSVDNYAPSASSMIYNRDVQADFADYVIIMAYDEHYSGGDEAGSVASIGFVEDAVKATLEEVPKEQVIMGMPLYSRVWYYDGTTLKSSAMGVAATANYIADHNMTMTWDEKLGQNYGEYTQDGVTYQLWQEDAFSIEEKLKVLTEHDLAGGAFWKLGFDDASIWSVTAKYLNP